jgi:hypothetical protein
MEPDSQILKVDHTLISSTIITFTKDFKTVKTARSLVASSRDAVAVESTYED